MSDENAEKAWRTQHPNVARSPIFDKGYAAGRVSRDAEVAELREVHKRDMDRLVEFTEARTDAEVQLAAERTRADKAETSHANLEAGFRSFMRSHNQVLDENERLREVIERVSVWAHEIAGDEPVTNDFKKLNRILEDRTEPQGDHENGSV